MIQNHLLQPFLTQWMLEMSNFVRIQEMYGNDLTEFKRIFSSYSFTDEETRVAIKSIYDSSGYVAEPHGAIGYLGFKKEIQNKPESIGFY